MLFQFLFEIFDFLVFFFDCLCQVCDTLRQSFDGFAIGSCGGGKVRKSFDGFVVELLVGGLTCKVGVVETGLARCLLLQAKLLLCLKKVGFEVGPGFLSVGFGKPDFAIYGPDKNIIQAAIADVQR